MLLNLLLAVSVFAAAAGEGNVEVTVTSIRETFSEESSSEEKNTADSIEDTDADRVINRSLIPDTICGTIQNHSAKHPWIGLLRDLRSDNSQIHYVCDSLLITQRYALIPAHCIKKHTNSSNPARYVLRLGMNVTQDIVVEAIAVHSDFYHIPEEFTKNKTIYYKSDVALLKLAEAVQFSDEVQPICLPAHDFYSKAAKGVTFEKYTGKILTGVSGHVVPHEQREADEFMISHKECSDAASQTSTTIPHIHQICAENNAKLGDQCGLRSSLMTFDTNSRRWFVIGINGMNIEDCGFTKSPYVYTAVPYYVRWIINNILE